MGNAPYKTSDKVAPFAGAWIEMCRVVLSAVGVAVAPFAGAWIEIINAAMDIIANASLPSRERGLKCNRN